jgi:hypothetical protein
LKVGDFTADKIFDSLPKYFQKEVTRLREAIENKSKFERLERSSLRLKANDKAYQRWLSEEQVEYLKNVADEGYRFGDALESGESMTVCGIIRTKGFPDEFDCHDKYDCKKFIRSTQLTKKEWCNRYAILIDSHIKNHLEISSCCPAFEDAGK